MIEIDDKVLSTSKYKVQSISLLHITLHTCKLLCVDPSLNYGHSFIKSLFK